MQPATIDREGDEGADPPNAVPKETIDKIVDRNS
jgi:hypothetical protein